MRIAFFVDDRSGGATMIAHDPARGIRKFMIAFCIAVMLLTAVLVAAAQAAPDKFGYISPFCSMFYTVGGTQYYIQNLGYALINGIPLMQYQVYWRDGSTWDFLANGLLGYQETHSESANIP